MGVELPADHMYGRPAPFMRLRPEGAFTLSARRRLAGSPPSPETPGSRVCQQLVSRLSQSLHGLQLCSVGRKQLKMYAFASFQSSTHMPMLTPADKEKSRACGKRGPSPSTMALPSIILSAADRCRNEGASCFPAGTGAGEPWPPQVNSFRGCPGWPKTSGWLWICSRRFWS